jgi:hypothetical protein
MRRKITNHRRSSVVNFEPSRLPRLGLPLKGTSRPLTLWLGSLTLLLAAAFNLSTFIWGVFSILSNDLETPTTAVLLVALSLAAVFLVVLPLFTGIAALRRSTAASAWATMYVVAQFLAAFQSLNAVQYLILNPPVDRGWNRDFGLIVFLGFGRD